MRLSKLLCLYCLQDYANLRRSYVLLMSLRLDIKTMGSFKFKDVFAVC